MIDNITLTISNTSSTVYHCSNMTELKLINMTSYIAKFTTWNNYFIAWLMNLSGNTINMFIFFNDITVATTSCDLNTVYFTLGKLALAMFKVAPVTGLRQGFVEEKESVFTNFV